MYTNFVIPRHALLACGVSLTNNSAEPLLAPIGRATILDLVSSALPLCLAYPWSLQAWKLNRCWHAFAPDVVKCADEPAPFSSLLLGDYRLDWLQMHGINHARTAGMTDRKGLEMSMGIIAVLAMLLAVSAGWAQGANYPKSKVSFDDFKGLVAAVESHRASRLVDLATFMKMSKEPGVIILDTRSTFRFERIHIKGARHLSFTDFTQDNLQKVIPSLETTILIYCNNNFDGNQTDFASKIAMPRAKSNSAAASQFAAQAKPIMMALNIPTYVNLYGYGYRNVYELDELVNVNDPRIAFEGTIVEPKPSPLPNFGTK